jgi:hypothetical protein
MQEPVTPAVGSLDDDMTELRKLLADPDRASAVDFDRIAAILKLLSAKLA